MPDDINPTERFTKTVGYYTQYRPSYPAIFAVMHRDVIFNFMAEGEEDPN